MAHPAGRDTNDALWGWDGVWPQHEVLFLQSGFGEVAVGKCKAGSSVLNTLQLCMQINYMQM